MIKGVMIMEVSWLAEQNVAFSSSSAASSSGSTSPVSPAPRKEHVRYDDVTCHIGDSDAGPGPRLRLAYTSLIFRSALPRPAAAARSVYLQEFFGGPQARGLG